VSETFLQVGIDAAERETAYLLHSETMKQRLLTAKERKVGIELGVVCEKLGI
jgi:predicted RNA polymerase sigma factor